MIYQYDGNDRIKKNIKENFKFYGKAKDKYGIFTFYSNSKKHLYKILNKEEITLLKLNIIEKG